MEDSGNTLNDKLIQWGKKNLLILGLFFLGLIFLVYGLIVLLGSSESKSDVIFESSNDAVLSSQSSSESKASQIVVDVEGAVLKPGIYKLATDSRVSDGLIAARGLSANANRDWLAKNLNLAAKLTDGAKIYIPKIGDDVKGITHSAGSGQASIKGGDAEDKININTASEKDLDTLSGVGPVTAEKIINGRPYNSIDELLSRKILGNKVFEEIKEKIRIY